MGGNPAHRMHRNRTPDHLVMLFAFPVGPGLVDHNLFRKGCLGKISCKLADPVRRDADSIADRLGRIGVIQPGF